MRLQTRVFWSWGAETDCWASSCTGQANVLSGLCSLFCLGFSLPTELTHPSISAGQRVLELGCGAGLLGVILHRAEAAAVCLTDGDAQALHNCRHNLHINGAEVCAQPSCQHSWAWQHAECLPTT